MPTRISIPPSDASHEQVCSPSVFDSSANGAGHTMMACLGFYASTLRPPCSFSPKPNVQLERTKEVGTVQGPACWSLPSHCAASKTAAATLSHRRALLL